jgi:hypothetical protein
VSPTLTSGVAMAAWSPDGKQIACYGVAGGVYLVDAARGDARLLVPKVKPPHALFVTNRPRSWQPR